MMLVRSMSPNVIAVDEIGSKEDVEALEYVMNCGVKILATVHGKKHGGDPQKTDSWQVGTGEGISAVCAFVCQSDRQGRCYFR